MSYDLRIAVKIDGLDRYYPIAYPDYDSPTYNLGEMFRACMNWDYEQGEYYRCSDIIENVENGILELIRNTSAYEQYEPENGWGNIQDAFDVLKSLKCCIYTTSDETNIPLQNLYVAW